jgi:hypothetical protein
MVAQIQGWEFAVCFYPTAGRDFSKLPHHQRHTIQETNLDVTKPERSKEIITLRFVIRFFSKQHSIPSIQLRNSLK